MDKKYLIRDQSNIYRISKVYDSFDIIIDYIRRLFNIISYLYIPIYGSKFGILLDLMKLTFSSINKDHNLIDLIRI